MTCASSASQARSCASASNSTGTLHTQQFQQYAQEDLGWVGRATTEDEKRALLELARHWMQVAVPSEGKVAVLQK
jgi:hypothetical protein